MDEAFTAVEHELGTTAARRLAGRSRAAHYRRPTPPSARRLRVAQVQPSALTTEEREAVLALMNSPEYAELPPAQIWARELDTGRYHCSFPRCTGSCASAASRANDAARPPTHWT